MNDERVRPWSVDRAEEEADYIEGRYRVERGEASEGEAETLRAYARLVRQQERILLLLERGRTDGGEVITSSKHAAEVIRRDILNEPEPA